MNTLKTMTLGAVASLSTMFPPKTVAQIDQSSDSIGNVLNQTGDRNEYLLHEYSDMIRDSVDSCIDEFWIQDSAFLSLDLLIPLRNGDIFCIHSDEESVVLHDRATGKKNKITLKVDLDSRRISDPNVILKGFVVKDRVINIKPEIWAALKDRAPEKGINMEIDDFKKLIVDLIFFGKGLISEVVVTTQAKNDKGEDVVYTLYFEDVE